MATGEMQRQKFKDLRVKWKCWLCFITIFSRCEIISKFQDKVTFVILANAPAPWNLTTFTEYRQFCRYFHSRSISTDSTQICVCSREPLSTNREHKHAVNQNHRKEITSKQQRTPCIVIYCPRKSYWNKGDYRECVRFARDFTVGSHIFVTWHQLTRKT